MFWSIKWSFKVNLGALKRKKFAIETFIRRSCAIARFIAQFSLSKVSSGWYGWSARGRGGEITNKVLFTVHWFAPVRKWFFKNWKWFPWLFLHSRACFKITERKSQQTLHSYNISSNSTLFDKANRKMKEKTTNSENAPN